MIIMRISVLYLRSLALLGRQIRLSGISQKFLAKNEGSTTFHANMLCSTEASAPRSCVSLPYIYFSPSLSSLRLKPRSLSRKMFALRLQDIAAVGARSCACSCKKERCRVAPSLLPFLSLFTAVSLPVIRCCSEEYTLLHRPTTFFGLPTTKAFTLSMATANKRPLASSVAHAICGVIKAFSHCSKGLSARGGSSLSTSAQ